MLDWASRAGLPVIASSALETSVGLGTGLAAAAALPDLPFACGLATASLLAGDVVKQPLLPIRGEMVVRHPVPSPDLLRKWRPQPETVAQMMARTEQADLHLG